MATKRWKELWGMKSWQWVVSLITIILPVGLGLIAFPFDKAYIWAPAYSVWGVFVFFLMAYMLAKERTEAKGVIDESLKPLKEQIDQTNQVVGTLTDRIDHLRHQMDADFAVVNEALDPLGMSLHRTVLLQGRISAGSPSMSAKLSVSHHRRMVRIRFWLQGKLRGFWRWVWG